MSKKAIDLMSANLDQIVVSDKFNYNKDGFKYFIAYQEDEIVKPLCIILHQMSGNIKYFEYGGPNMSFFIKDEEVGEKSEEIWGVINHKLKIKFNSEPVYEYEYLKTKVREYDGAIKKVLGKDIPKENMHYTCIACITIDSVMKMDKKYFLQVYLEECKHKIKIKMSRFINAELDSDSGSDDDSDNDIDPDKDSNIDSDNDSHNDSDDDSDDDSDK